MTTAFSTSHVTVYQGDVRDCLAELPDESVDCCVTSPPYWGLRDYGVAGQLGLEPTPDEYVQNMVDVFREVRRVLRSSGTLWLNLGDSYLSRPDNFMRDRRGHNSTLGGLPRPAAVLGAPHRKPQDGIKPKDMVGIPWRVAFALQADGWYLRSDIIWSKPNPMPESVTDRPTKAHEYVFLLTKSARYCYDAEAITEPVSPNTNARVSQNLAAQIGSHRANGGSKTNGPMKAVVRGKTVEPGQGIKNNTSMAGALSMPVLRRNARTVWEIPTQPYSGAHFATFPRELPKRCIRAGCPVDGVVLDPFAGSGTTLAVARDLGRKSIGIELNSEYVRLIEKRCGQLALELPA